MAAWPKRVLTIPRLTYSHLGLQEARRHPGGGGDGDQNLRSGRRPPLHTNTHAHTPGVLWEEALGRALGVCGERSLTVEVKAGAAHAG